jgi:tRNA-splicing ligase RtcB
MCAVSTTFDPDDVRDSAQDIFDVMYATIPLGFNHHATRQIWNDEALFKRTPFADAVLNDKGWNQLGTLGGGNHFIEVGVEESSNVVWVILHSGSRNLGHTIATHYMKEASGDGKAREGHYGLSTSSMVGRAYIMDLEFALQFALENRKQVLFNAVNCINRFAKGSYSHEFINRNHNHAEFKDGLWIHRKGATHADLGMKGVIPGNMRDGSFIVMGKGNPDSLCSSSHGAGRVKGRKDAKGSLCLTEFETQMEGIVANVSNNTLDESPNAYKNIFTVMEEQKDLVSVIAHVKPILNVKG